MVRTQIQLTEKQARGLKNLAARQDRSVADLIRQAVDAFIRTVAATGDEERRLRALAASGRFRSGSSDLGAAHDKHLADALK
jgi:hypothetical protein